MIKPILKTFLAPFKIHRVLFLKLLGQPNTCYDFDSETQNVSQMVESPGSKYL